MLAIVELQAPPEVIEALRTGRRNGQWIRARCPYCDPGGRRRRNLAASHTGFGRHKNRAGWLCHACHAEKDQDRYGSGSKMRLEYDPNSARDDEKRRKDGAIRIIEAARPIEDGDPVDMYLRRRNLTPLTAVWPSSLRHGYLRHPETKKRYHAMVAIVTSAENMAIGVHRTFLTDDGRKADVPLVKMTYGPIGGGAIRLGVDSERIVVAEGIESAIAAGHATGYVPWSAMSTGNMVGLDIPRNVNEVIIASDNDENGAGDRAAYSLRNRIKKLQIEQQREIKVMIKAPPIGRSDFADFG